MCPDYQIISVYLDEELPSPWKEKMELHLRSCPVCSARLERMRRYSEALGKLPDEGLTPKISAMEAAKDRIWQRMMSLETENWGWRSRGHNFWRRTLSIPLPVAAAAAAVLIMFFALALFQQPTRIPPSQDTMAASEMVDMQDIIPASDMNSILQYLGNEDMTDLVIIRLPETSSFFSSGEPTILRAADYSRSNRSP